MRDWLFRLLFPKQYEQIKCINELLKVSSSPDCRVSAPDGVCFKDISVYLITNAQGSVINCKWIEIPCEVESDIEL